MRSFLAAPLNYGCRRPRLQNPLGSVPTYGSEQHNTTWIIHKVLIQHVLCVIYYACRQNPRWPNAGLDRRSLRRHFARLKIPSKYCAAQYVSKVAEAVKELCDAIHTDTSLVMVSTTSLCSASASFPVGWKSAGKSAPRLTFCSRKAVKTDTTSGKPNWSGHGVVRWWRRCVALSFE